MLLLGWVQLATADQTKLEPFVPGRCFLAQPSVLAKFPRRQSPCPSNFQLTHPQGWEQLTFCPDWSVALLCAAKECRVPFPGAATVIGGCDPSSSREAVQRVREQ